VVGLWSRTTGEPSGIKGGDGDTDVGWAHQMGQRGCGRSRCADNKVIVGNLRREFMDGNGMPSETLKKCDIIMEGGITSGIVYPGLICKLAERYQFQSIGGTSAGAIAAALTAAAEYGRRKGLDSFTAVKEVPEWLGKSSEKKAGSNLFSLFQPQKRMKVLFRLATAFLYRDGRKELRSSRKHCGSKC